MKILSDERMKAYFSMFPSKTLDSHLYHNRLTFWKKVIEAIGENHELHPKRCFLINLTYLEHQLTRKGIKPMGLKTVLVISFF